MLASHLLCRDTKESTGLLSGGSGSSPGSVVPISVTLALSLVPCSPLLTFPSSRWLHFSDFCRGELGCTVMIRVCKAQIYCSHCAEGKFLLLSCICWLKQSISLLPFNHYLDSHDVTALPADTLKVLLAVPLKQRFLQVQPPTLHPSIGKEVQAGDGLSNNPCKSHQTLVPLLLLPWEFLIWQIKWASAALAAASFAGWTPL